MFVPSLSWYKTMHFWYKMAQKLRVSYLLAVVSVTPSGTKSESAVVMW